VREPQARSARRQTRAPRHRREASRCERRGCVPEGARGAAATRRARLILGEWRSDDCQEASRAIHTTGAAAAPSYRRGVGM